MERKEVISNVKIRITIFLLVVVLCGYVGYLFTHIDQLTNEKKTNISLEAVSSETTERIPLVNGEELSQQIDITDTGELKEIKIKLVDISENITGNIEFMLKNTNGKVVYSVQIPCASLTDGTYYSMSGFSEIDIKDINLNVHNKDTLYFTCIAQDVSKSPSFIVCQRANTNTLCAGGRQMTGRFLLLEYQIATQVHYWWFAIFVIILLITVGWGILRGKQTYVRCLNMICIFLPVFVLFYAAWLNGTRAYLKTVYGIINFLLLYLIYCILQGIVGRKGGELLFLFTGTGIALGNYYLNQFRGQPLMVTDIFSASTAVTVVKNYTFQLSFSVLTVFVITILLMIAILHSDFSHMREKLKLIKKKTYALRALLASSGIIILISVCYATPMNLSGWNISDSFEKYGWIYTNTKLIKSYWNISPDGYNKTNAEKFIETEAIKENEITNLIPNNLIVIMDESFSDLSVLGDFETDQDVLPYFSSLKNNDYVEKGWLGVHVIGGGTATTEWEVLTGGNSTFMDIGSLNPYNLLESGVSKYNYINLCTSAKNVDYKTIAMHPFYGKNYSRDKLYPLFGFDDYKNMDNYYQGAEWIRWCVSDDADVDGIIEQYENKGSEKLFIFNVTMQNHGGYSYPMDNYTVHATGIESDELNSYLTLTHYSDQALQKLITYFLSVEEPTMIVFFGDHQPALTDDFYEQVLKTTNPNDKQNETKYITPYLIWSNYSRETYNKPYISAGYLSAIIKAEAGLELTQWDYYLLNMMQKYPVIGNYGFFDSDYEFHTYSTIDEEDRKYIKQMKYAQYYWWTY